jgi:hypothetical protein
MSPRKSRAILDYFLSKKLRIALNCTETRDKMSEKGKAAFFAMR